MECELVVKVYLYDTLRQHRSHVIATDLSLAPEAGCCPTITKRRCNNDLNSLIVLLPCLIALNETSCWYQPVFILYCMPIQTLLRSGLLNQRTHRKVICPPSSCDFDTLALYLQVLLQLLWCNSHSLAHVYPHCGACDVPYESTTHLWLSCADTAHVLPQTHK